MSELTGLELRKAACEALGYWWEGGTSAGYWHSSECPHPPRPGLEGCDFAGHLSPRYSLAIVPMAALPAIESDPGVCWPIALEWCRKNGILWEMASYKTPDQHRYSLGLLGKDVDIEANGSNPCEAWARVIAKVGRRA